MSITITASATDAVGATATTTTTVTQSGGYNNLTNWPSAANRPTISGNTLSWIGPIGGGPSTSNDVSQSRILTSSGPISTSSNGQVIEGKDIVGQVHIDHDNVILRQCRIRWNSASTYAISSGCVIETDASNVVVEDCMISDNGGNGQQNGINIGWFNTGKPQNTIRRCNVFRFGNMIPSQSRILAIDNWFHLGRGDVDHMDMFELYGNAPGGGSQDVVIRHNCLDGRDNLGINNIGINMTNEQGGFVKNITIDNNAFLQSGTYYAIGGGDIGTGGAMNFSATNNGFFNVGIRQPGISCSPNSGNFLMSTATSTSGSLVNGNGII